MLTLPRDWRSNTAGSVALRLLTQIPTESLQTQFVRHLIGASLDLMLAALGTKADPSLRVQSQSDLLWRIGNSLYAYLPRVDDNALQPCAHWARETHSLLVIVPAKHELLLRHALDSLLGGRSPSVFSLDLFINWRVTFASLDARQGYDETLLDLLARHNHKVARAQSDNSILVGIPNSGSIHRVTS